MLALIFNRRLNAGSSSQATQDTQASGRVVYHADVGTSQASQYASAAGRIEYHAGAATVQGSQSGSAAGRLVYHAAGITAQASQSMTAFGRVVYHANGGSTQASQFTAGAGRVVYHAANVTQQSSQSMSATARVEYHAGGASGQASQSVIALGHVIPFIGVIGGLVASQRSQSMAAFGAVTNPAAPEQPGGNVSRHIHDYAAGDFGTPLVRGNGGTAQASQITEARGRVIRGVSQLAYTGTSSFHDISTDIQVPNTENYVFNPPPTPICMPIDIQTADETSDDELAEVFAMAA